MRSISLYGLSDVIMTFEESTDDYFARQVVFRAACPTRTLPSGVTPSLAPLSSPSGLVYRYVIESPDRSPQELKTYRGLGRSSGPTNRCRAWPTIPASAAR